jgi:hypothetical protein
MKFFDDSQFGSDSLILARFHELKHALFE